MLEGEMVADLDELGLVYDHWDALAVAAGRPQMAPAWVLSWWRHVAPPDSAVRVVVVRDRDRIVGLAPFFVRPRARTGGHVDYRLPGLALAVRLSPLALPGQEWQVAETVAAALARAEPRPDVIALEGVPVASHWPAALRERWPGRVRPLAFNSMTYRSDCVSACPTVSLRASSFEEWLAGKSANFRERARKVRRKFEAAGGSLRLSTRESLSADVETLLRLHRERWSDRGSTLTQIGEPMQAMLEESGRMLLGQGRFRLWIAEVEGEPICADIHIAAGGEVVAINGGWTARFRALNPRMLVFLGAIGDGLRRGDRRLDLGPGESQYKRRFADGNDPVRWTVLMPVGSRTLGTMVRVTPALLGNRARASAKRILAPAQVERLRTAVNATRGRPGLPPRELRRSEASR